MHVVTADHALAAGLDFFAGASAEWTFTPENPRQCLDFLFIVNDLEFEGPVAEMLSASFNQEGLGVQETLICILDDEPGNSMDKAKALVYGGKSL